jgi:hypothetical protein
MQRFDRPGTTVGLVQPVKARPVSRHTRQRPTKETTRERLARKFSDAHS